MCTLVRLIKLVNAQFKPEGAASEMATPRPLFPATRNSPLPPPASPRTTKHHSPPHAYMYSAPSVLTLEPSGYKSLHHSGQCVDAQNLMCHHDIIADTYNKGQHTF